jgi:hypothetical protein
MLCGLLPMQQVAQVSKSIAPTPFLGRYGPAFGRSVFLLTVLLFRWNKPAGGFGSFGLGTSQLQLVQSLPDMLTDPLGIGRM